MGSSNKRANKQGQGRRGRSHPSHPPPPPPPGGYRIVVLVGIPGSGKSTFSSFLGDMGWTAVNQDTLGSRERCRRRAEEILKQGGRVIVDRCNFNPSQRVTWIDLALSLSLHKDACIAVWLDIDIGVCQDRVQRRVGHPTLGPTSESAAVVKMVARALRAPHQKEGFHAVIRCKGDQQGLSEAVAPLSACTGSENHGNGGRGKTPPLVEADGGCGSGGAAWGVALAAGDCPAYERDGSAGDFDKKVSSGGQNEWTAWSEKPPEYYPEGIVVAGGGAVPAHPSFTSVPADGGGMITASGGAAGQGFPSDVAAYSDKGPVRAWGGRQHQQVGIGRFHSPCEGVTPVSTCSNVSLPAHEINADLYPALPSGNSTGGKRANACQVSGRIGMPQAPPQARVPSPTSLDSIAKLTQQGIAAAAAASAAARRPQQQQRTNKRNTMLLTPAETPASFSGRQPPPRVIARQELFSAATAAARKSGPAVGATGVCDGPRAAVDASNTPVPAPLLLATGSFKEWTSRSGFPSDRGGGSSGRPQEVPGSPPTGAECRIGRGGDAATPARVGRGERGGAGGEQMAPRGGPEGEELALSDGEAFFMLEDMFGDMLLPGSLEEIFRESGNDLEKAVKGSIEALEAIAADAWSAPGTPTSATIGTAADLSTAEACSKSWEDESEGELVDVAGWTDDQIVALKDLCLAFEGTFSREGIIAALTASNHDVTSAAQLLLDSGADSSPSREQRAAGGREPNSSSDSSTSSRSTSSRRRIQSSFRDRGGRVAPASAMLLGATCGGDAKTRRVSESAGGYGRGEAEWGRQEKEEEEGDEGLSSEEYRARANEAAEEMKHWFRKAAEALAKNGRHGGAAAADPSQTGQRWKKEMGAANLRAAREAFRERNPTIRVGYADDGVSVLKVLGLPRSSECSPPGQLSVDLHMLHRAEALSVLEAILQALARSKVAAARPPSRGRSYRADVTPAGLVAGQRFDLDDNRGSAAAAATAAVGDSRAETGGGGGGGFSFQIFNSLKVVVGRGAHSVNGVPRLRPCVAGYLGSKGLRVKPVEVEQGPGVLVVDLDKL